MIQCKWTPLFAVDVAPGDFRTGITFWSTLQHFTYLHRCKEHNESLHKMDTYIGVLHKVYLLCSINSIMLSLLCFWVFNINYPINTCNRIKVDISHSKSSNQIQTKLFQWYFWIFLLYFLNVIQVCIFSFPAVSKTRTDKQI